ncbi:LamG-like jellyroll fold domain-containing protein, partial [Neptuniibacter sp.]|uniref:LamG-like jellyroll fold domain-containing protein n=1 Tax=Neptuniibacter sp. TaxID=1962643 RepID=UPI002615615E
MKEMKIGNPNEKGFTLGELLVVIAIMTILVAVAVGAFTGLIGSGKSESAKFEKEAVQSAVETYLAVSGTTVVTARSGAAVITSNDGDAPFSTYLRRLPTSYQYTWTATGSVTQFGAPSTGGGGASWTNTYSADFDGSDDIIVGPATNAIIGENVQNMTMSCWVKTTNSAAQYVMSLKRLTPSSHSTLFSMGVNNPTGQVYLLTYNGSHTYLNSIGQSVDDGNWHHICAVVDGSTRTLYLDGSSVGSDSNGISNVTGNTDYFTVGGFVDPYGSL